MADSGEGKPDAGEVTQIVQLEKKFDDLMAVVQGLANSVVEPQTNQLSTAVNPETLLREPGDIMELRKQLGEKVDDRNFRDGDIVQIAEGTDYADRVRAGLKLGPDDELPKGIVINRLYKHKTGPWKYKVHWQNLGRDGCLENEIKLISRPAR